MSRIKVNDMVFMLSVSILYLFISSSVHGATNLATSVTVSDIDPYGFKVDTCDFAAVGKSDGGSYTPSAAANYNVGCNVTVFDVNGYEDIDVVWASFFFNDNGYSSCDTSGEADNDDCYLNSSCSALNGTGSAQSQSYHCDFGNVAYYADTGTWNFTAYANDTDGGVNATNYSSYTIASLKSLNSSASLSFGSQTAGATTVVDTDLFIENQGNTELSVTVQGNAAMKCTTGSIPLGNIKYDSDADNGDNTAYVSACGTLTTSAVWDAACTTLTIFDEEAPSVANHVRGTYWGINITAGVSGTCNNSLTFTAN